LKKTFLIVLPLFFLLFLPSCGGVWMGEGEGDSTVRDKYDPGLDKMTYAEVINDMWNKWGEPTYMAEGDAQNIFMLTYHKESKKLVTQTVYHKADFFDEATSESEQVLEAGNIETYEFVFDKENKLLIWYSHYVHANGHIQENFDSGDQKCKYLDVKKLRYIVGSEKTEIVNQARGKSQAKVKAVPAAAVPVKPVNAVSPLEKKLNELKSLRDKKVITEDEYAKMREKALNDYK
jgi:hypothetical protein